MMKTYNEDVVLKPIILTSCMVCQSCGAENPLKSKVCRACGAKLYVDIPGRKCPVCLAPLKLARILGPGHIMCNICFSEFQVISGRTVSSLPSTTPHFDKGRVSKKTKLLVGGIAVFLLFLLLIGFSTIEQRYDRDLTTVIVTKSVGELLPTREELPTEWIFSRKTNISINATGFLEGVELVTAKQELLGGAGATIRIYKFNTTGDAEKYYMNMLTILREKGGYKEISTNLRAKAYGTFIEAAIAEVSTIYFVKYNIYCEIRVRGAYYYSTRDDAIQLSRIILQKI
jgi:hypothetical protein